MYQKEISISESNAIKGLAILIIILHHFEQSCLSIDILNVFKAFGPVGCSAFFFISGYGLCVSKSEKKLEYWKRRLMKIWIPFILANIIYINFNFKIISNIGDLILFVLGIKLINGHFWFIHALLFLYIGYALSSKFKHNIIIYPVIFGVVYSILTRSVGTISWVAFPIGIAYAQHLGGKRNSPVPLSSSLMKILLYFCIPVFIISCSIYYTCSFMINNILLFTNFLAMIVSSAFVFVVIRKYISSKVLVYLGLHSIDYYLIHGLCLMSLLPFNYINHNIILLYFMILVFISSTIFGYISSFVKNFFRL